MRPTVYVVLAGVLCLPAAAQMAIQRPINPAVSRLHVQSPAAVFAIETPESCAVRNAFLKQKTAPALQAQLAQLQSQIADRRAHSYSCTPNGFGSVSGTGVVTDCGVYACSPIDGMCRSWAKTSDDCAIGYLWDGYRSCVPEH